MENVSAHDPVQRANALEVIETVGDRELVRPLVGLWEDAAGRADPDWRSKVVRHTDEPFRTSVTGGTGAYLGVRVQITLLKSDKDRKVAPIAVRTALRNSVPR